MFSVRTGWPSVSILSPSEKASLLLLLRSKLYLWGSPFFFFCIPSYISGVHHSSSSAFPAVSLGFTILGEIFAHVTIFLFVLFSTIEGVTRHLHGLKQSDLQLLSQCGSTYSCLSRPVPEIHQHVAGTLSKQPTNNSCQCFMLCNTVNQFPFCTVLVV